MFSLFEEKKIKFKKCARAILDSDNKMPSCLPGMFHVQAVLKSNRVLHEAAIAPFKRRVQIVTIKVFQTILLRHGMKTMNCDFS